MRKGEVRKNWEGRREDEKKKEKKIFDLRYLKRKGEMGVKVALHDDDGSLHGTAVETADTQVAKVDDQ